MDIRVGLQLEMIRSADTGRGPEHPRGEVKNLRLQGVGIITSMDSESSGIMAEELLERE